MKNRNLAKNIRAKVNDSAEKYNIIFFKKLLDGFNSRVEKT